MTQASTITEHQSGQELQNQVTELQKQVTELQKQLQQVQTENQALATENQELHDRLQTPFIGNHVPPDYEAIRTRTLNKLKVGRQSAAGKAIDAFIREL